MTPRISSGARRPISEHRKSQDSLAAPSPPFSPSSLHYISSSLHLQGYGLPSTLGFSHCGPSYITTQTQRPCRQNPCFPQAPRQPESSSLAGLLQMDRRGTAGGRQGGNITGTGIWLSLLPRHVFPPRAPGSFDSPPVPPPPGPAPSLAEAQDCQAGQDQSSSAQMQPLRKSFGRRNGVTITRPQRSCRCHL